ncbi:diacylglycerol kinase family lipid kinase [Bacteroidales bacterium OttesenSCG-928-K03]|nr:diacylglycerol kinase family lipid kinase [Odoribacter sp. OttesenSCG-928-L07]MDL2239004.1 diacylglycerol kinase family lipid kinase [Bacteroidales bacterium OttesenSCG-928-L14]MDL2240708.1 diacylglycerol kinase family lipid kinase [Bacteroidales bacterium OttesenSCG-928-K22]MDL2242158.1 diacylglycerol kinase family lipid kinase [Bacteroidales bacterium OttesenSCG-928-K03]
MSEWLIMVNPNAGKRKGEKDWAEISRKLVEKGFEFKTIFTQHRNHAIHLTKNYIKKGFRKFIVVGGDGTLNEVVNGIMTQNFCKSTDVTIGIIPVGTGNDWCKSYGIEHDYDQAIDVIANCKTILQDVGKVRYKENKNFIDRYIVNSAGVGFEALVVQATNQQKESGKRNPILYLSNVLKYFSTYKGRNVVLNIDGRIEKKNLYLCSIGICKYKGNGMKLLPYAIPDDGLLDVTLINNAPIRKLVKYIFKIIKGNLDEVKFAETLRCKKISVDSETEELIMEVDGESLGNNPYTFEIVPLAVNVIIHDKSW